jgi:ribosome-associated protein
MSTPGAPARTTDTKNLPLPIQRAIKAAQDKKAADIVVMDLREAGAFTDFFVICSGQNPRQVKAIAEHVEEALREAHIRPAHHEGYQRAEWVLLDYFDFIVHVFHRETRLFYALDRLWGSAPRIVPPDREGLAAAGPLGP